MKPWATAAGFAALVLASAALRADAAHYARADDDPIGPPWSAFRIEGTCGSARVDGGILVEIPADRPDCAMRVVAPLERPAVPVEIQTSARALGVGDLAAVEFLVLDADGRPIDGKGADVVSFPGPDSTFRTYERRLSADLRHGRTPAISVDLVGPGRIEVRSLAAWPARVRPLWRIARMIVTTGWLGAFVAAIALAADRLPRRIESLLVILVVALIVLGVTVPAVSNTWMVSRAWHAVDAATRTVAPPESAAGAVRFSLMRALISIKTAHVIVFAVLGAAGMRAVGRFAPVALACIGLAAASEAIELLRLDRTPTLTDIGIDALGALAGIGLVWVAARWSGGRGGADG